MTIFELKIVTHKTKGDIDLACQMSCLQQNDNVLVAMLLF